MALEHRQGHRPFAVGRLQHQPQFVARRERLQQRELSFDSAGLGVGGDFGGPRQARARLHRHRHVCAMRKGEHHAPWRRWQHPRRSGRRRRRQRRGCGPNAVCSGASVDGSWRRHPRHQRGALGGGRRQGRLGGDACVWCRGGRRQGRRNRRRRCGRRRITARQGHRRRQHRPARLAKRPAKRLAKRRSATRHPR